MGWRLPVTIVLVLVVTMLLASCGEVPDFRWNFGRPTSFTFTEAGLQPESRSAASAAVTGRAASALTGRAATIDHVDYGDLADGPMTAADVQSIREQHGTLLETYTPDVFRIPMVKVGFLSSETSDGFWVILASEGIFGEMEFIDFRNPVYITSKQLWDNIHYDLLFSRFNLGISDIGGEPYYADIQVTAPGYDIGGMPDRDLGTKGPIREYLGDNRFAVTADELFLTATPYNYAEDEWQGGNGWSPFGWNPPTMLLFRENIASSGVYRWHWELWMEELTIEERRELSAERSFALLGGNQWDYDQPFGISRWGSPSSWVDMPFDGLHVGQDTEELVITVSWDIKDIIELWDFGEDGLHFQIAADFIDRFSVVVEQITG